MGQPIPTNAAGSPTRWLVVFDRRAATWWADLVAFGRRKHVRCFRWVKECDCALFFDCQFSGTFIHVLCEDEAIQLMGEWMADADVLQIEVAPSHSGPRRQRLLAPSPLLCTTSVARLLGLPCALRPDALYRQCLRHGATIVQVAHGADNIDHQRSRA